MKKSRLFVMLCSVLWMLPAFLIPNIALAITSYEQFGSFPDATWGGSGIPNDAVAVSRQIVDGDVTITIAMSATQRYSNPPLSNDGAGKYFAGTGSNFAGDPSIEGALWNFDYFIKVEGTNGATPKLIDYQFDLLYDFDPASNTPFSNLGKLDLTASITAGAYGGPNATLAEDSQNLMFSFLATTNSPYVYAPTGTFDPNAIGNYQFALQVSKDGFSLNNVAMEVQTVPIPAAVWLFGSGLLGLIVVSRRK